MPRDMEYTEHDIDLIDRYLREELSDGELAAFEARLREEPEFAAEVQRHREMTGVIRQAGRASMRSTLGAIGAEMAATGDFKKYEPESGSGNAAGGGGSNFIGWLLRMLVVGGSIAAAWYFFRNKEQVNPTQEIRRDTIIQEKRDTLIKKVPSSGKPMNDAGPESDGKNSKKSSVSGHTGGTLHTEQDHSTVNGKNDGLTAAISHAPPTTKEIWVKDSTGKMVKKVVEENTAHSPK